MVTLLSLSGILASGLLAVLICVRRLPSQERSLIPLAVAAHACAAFAHVWVVENIYGGGDMLMYWETGQGLVALLGHDVPRFLETVLRLIFQDPEVPVPITVYGRGTSTGTMSGLAAALAYALPDSIEAACVLVSMSALVGKLLMFRALRESLPPTLRRTVLLAVLLLPSSLFWSAGLLKESLLILPLGMATYGAHTAITRSRFVALPLILLGGLGVALLKPYLIIALAAAFGVWLYVDRAIRRDGRLRVRPLYLLLATAIGLGSSILIGIFFPQYALENLADEASRLQTVGSYVEGGSNYFLAPTPGAGPLQQLALAPAALVAGLFRPFLFEAHSLTMLLAAIETTLIAILVFRAIRRPGMVRFLTSATSASTLLLCISFSLLVAVAVGLASTNLGTLSRYRMPMMPFLVSALIVLGAPRSVSSQMGARRSVRAVLKRPSTSLSP